MAPGNWAARATLPWSAAVVAHATVSVVVDPDGLMAHPAVVAALADRGVATLALRAAMAFRRDYDGTWRDPRPSGPAHVAVVVPAPFGERDVPFDVLARARADGTLFTALIATTFPHLDAGVVADLGQGDLAIWDALPDPPARPVVAPFGGPRRLDASATRDVALQAAWGIDPARLRTPADVVAALLAWHDRPGPAVASLADHLAGACRVADGVDAWPLAAWVCDRAACLHAVMAAWHAHLLANGWSDPEAEPGTAPVGDGVPPGLAAGVADARVVAGLGRLFESGALPRVAFVPPGTGAADAGASAMPGVLGFGGEDGAVRLARALDRAVGAGLPGPDALARDWLAFARGWAPVTVLRGEGTIGAGHAVALRMDAVHDDAERRFEAWLTARSCANYDGLFTLLRLAAPMTLDKVAGHAASHLSRQGPTGRVAVVVVDGMGLAEWQLVRPAIRLEVPGAIAVDEAAFAMVPTLTCVSRQAIFAGATPAAYATSAWALRTNANERAQWAAFWAAQEAVPGLPAAQVAYVSQGARDLAHLGAEVDAAIADGVRALGIVAIEVDKIMHGALGMADHLGRVRSLASEGIAAIVGALARAGFTTFVTSDHGGVETVGSGLFVRAGVMATLEGSRATMFASDALRDAAVGGAAGSDLSACIPWASRIRDDFRPLFPPPRLTFGSDKGRPEVTHGGIAFEEVIVPFVRVDPR